MARIRRDKYYIDLTSDGIACIPVLGCNEFDRLQEAAQTHVHKGCLEVVYCRRGMLEYESDGRRYDFRPGSVFTSLPDEPHRMLSYPKGLATYYLLFKIPPRCSSFLNLSVRDAKWLRNQLLTMPQRLFAATPRIPALFRELFHLYETLPRRSLERAFRMRRAAIDLLLEVTLASRNCQMSGSSLGIQTVIEEMKSHPERSYTIDELTERTAFSPAVLTSRFRMLTGLPPHAYLVACRIAKSKEMLRAGRASVAFIAHSLGFPSASHFATSFKAMTGVTPVAYRRAQSAKQA
ncbi:MAG: helix-turn-helix transcriptional regulator [Kiritimatiellae bacterium]|nr:helix-turn-helix transcriptional regulator [Kiritimatiellia bacterium]